MQCMQPTYIKIVHGSSINMCISCFCICIKNSNWIKDVVVYNILRMKLGSHLILPLYL
jgi:hypothetical protein